MAKMRAVPVTKAKGPLQLVERAVPQPRSREVRIKVEACGICHSDSLTKEGLWPGIEYPRVPGHEIAGVLDAIGPEVPEWEMGQRVGVGWFGGQCGQNPVGAATSSHVEMGEFPAFRMTEDTPIM